MANRTYKMIQLVGTSSTSYEEAINQAVEKASASLHGLDWFEVDELRGRIHDGKVAQYQVKLSVGMKLDD